MGLRAVQSSFRDFMKATLHGDGEGFIGYYERKISTVGREGDFSTSATLSPGFSQAVGHWVREELEERGLRHVIECGPGEGSLMQGVARNLGRWFRFKNKVRFHLVETSESLQSVQEAKLSGLPIQWHRSVGEALDASQGEALLYSNELADAFPVHLLEWTRGQWKEVWVEHDEKWKVSAEMLRPWSPPSGIEAWPFSALNFSNPSEGQRIELGIDYGQWLMEVGRGLKNGSLLTIDYGGPFPDLYQRQPRGTLRAYRAHQRMVGDAIYAEPGHRDLTADVNFSDLEAWGERFGLRKVERETQSEFLRSRLSQKEFEQDQALAFLADPAGPGAAFQVLSQRMSP